MEQQLNQRLEDTLSYANCRDSLTRFKKSESPVKTKQFEMTVDDKLEIKRREKKRKVIDSQLVKEYKAVIDNYLC